MRVAVLAGEASSDALLAELVPYLPKAEFFGVCGGRSEHVGVHSLVPQAPFRLMGAEPLLRAPSLIQVLRNLVSAIRSRQPDVLLCVDSPGLARVVRPWVEAPALQWVCPQVWAWRKGRIRRLARSFQGIAALFPFEPGWFAHTDLEVRFTGHPFAAPRRSPRPSFTGLAAGSRESERTLLGPRFRAALRNHQVVEATPYGCTPICPNAPQVRSAAELAQRVDRALVCSGTATLELGVAGVPMVCGWATDPWTLRVARRLVDLPAFSLPNLLLGRSVVPEFLQEFRAVDLTEALRQTEPQVEPLLELRHLLKPQGSVARVADWLASLGGGVGT